MTDHIDTTAEREWLEGLRNRPLSASDRASLMVTFSVTLDALDAERARAEKTEAMLDHTQQWYAERVRKIEDVAKREGLWPEIAAILANGSATRQMPDGSFLYDPPTYAQQLNTAKHRAEKAEAELNKAADVIATILYRIGGYTERSSGAALDAVDRLIKERDQALARLAAAYKAADICALTPADAEAALQRVVDAAWNEALHEAEAAAEEVVTIWEAVMAIRALKRPETSHE